MKLNVGIISIGFTNFRYDIAQDYLSKSIEILKLNDNINLIEESDILLEEIDIVNYLAEFKKKDLDLLICQVGTFSMGANMVNIIDKVGETPLFLCGFRDPIIKGYNTIPLNSLTGFNMFTSFLKKMNKKFSYVYGTLEEEHFFNKINNTIEALYVNKHLRNAKFCVVGSRVPGFYLSEVDQLGFRKKIGPEIVYWSVGSLVKQAKEISISRVNEEIGKFDKKVIITSTNEMVEKNIRIQLAIEDYKNANNISAFSIKCWPEFQELYGTAVCLVLSRLTNKGILTSCEGDITGLATMYIQYILTNKAPFFTDLVNISKQGTVKAWHCGQAPESLAESDVKYCEHPTMKNGLGVSVQFDMIKSEVNMSKLSEGNGEYKLFNLKGKSVETDRELEGSQTDLVFEKNIDEILEIIVEEGIEHHYSVIHENIEDILKEYCKWTDVKYLG